MTSVSGRHAPSITVIDLARKTTISGERKREGRGEERLALLTRRVDESSYVNLADDRGELSLASRSRVLLERARERARVLVSQPALDQLEGLCATAKDVISEIFVPNFHRSIFKERACEPGLYLQRFECLQQLTMIYERPCFS